MPPSKSWRNGGWSKSESDVRAIQVEKFRISLTCLSSHSETSIIETVGSFSDQLTAHETFMADASAASSQHTDFPDFTASLAQESGMFVMAEDAVPESQFQHKARDAELQVKNLITSKFGNDEELMRRAERIRQVLKDYQAGELNCIPLEEDFLMN
jgi:hypothetical protein